MSEDKKIINDNEEIKTESTTNETPSFFMRNFKCFSVCLQMDVRYIPLFQNNASAKKVLIRFRKSSRRTPSAFQ